MEFTLYVQELIINFHCILSENRKVCREWIKPDEDKKTSKKWILYLYFMTLFSLNKKEDASVANTQEEVSSRLYTTLLY